MEFERSSMRSISRSDMRNGNASLLLQLVREDGQLTRKQLEEKSGLSWGAVSGITSRLCESGYLREIKCTSSVKSGRTPSFLELDNDKNFVIGIDVNRVGIRTSILDLSGKSRKSFDFREETDYGDKASLLKSIVYALRSTLTHRPDKAVEDYRILCIGVAMQGPVDVAHGISESVPGVSDWHDVPLCDFLEEAFSIPVYMQHDTECLLTSETGTTSASDAILLRLDRGVGIAASVDGSVAEFGSPEIEHTVVFPKGRKCPICGRNGCLAAYVTADSARENGYELTGEALAYAIYNAMHYYPCEQVVLCGKLLEEANRFDKQFRSELGMLLSKQELPEIVIRADADASVGAALLALKKCLESADL